MNYEIISSGSSGNSVVINDIIFDVGVSYKAIKDYLYDTKIIILTHTHSDHVKKSTLNRIRREFPRITVVGNYEVAQQFDVDIVSLEDTPLVVDDYVFIPFVCPHDVLNYGYIWEHKGKNYLYATDTASMDNCPEWKFDYMFLESNHDEKKINKIQSENHNGYRPFISAKRHLSTQECKLFYFMNRRENDSLLVELHKSNRFY